MSDFDKLPRICLNMIVKDEEHVITDSLECALPHIDYYIISDTGSSDNTVEVIKNYFKKKGIPGEVHHTPWQNFGYNRSEALRLCKGKAQYAWIIDADDLVVGNLKFPEVMDADAYIMKYESVMTYQRVQVFRTDADWKYIGVLHEYPEAGIEKPVIKILNGDYYIASRRLGNRNKDPEKYKKDAIILEKELEKNPSDTRNVFYCAQSYFDYENFEKAAEKYSQRVAMGGWKEEVFVSQFRIAACLQRMKENISKVINALFAAIRAHPDRAEAYFELARLFRYHQRYREAYEFAKLGSKLKYDQQFLFCTTYIYDYGLLDELSLAAYYCGYYEESYNLCTQLLKNKNIPDSHLERIRENQKYSKANLHLPNAKGKPLLCFYLGYSNAYDPGFMIYGSEIAAKCLAREFTKDYRVTFVEVPAKSQGEIEPGIFRLPAFLYNQYQTVNNTDVLIVSRYLAAFMEHTIRANKVFLWAHDIIFSPAWQQSFPSNGKFFVENLDSSISGYVGLTEWHKRLLSVIYSGLPEKKIHVIGNGLQIENFDFSEKVERIPYRLIWTSSPDRGLDDLIEMVHILHKEYPQIELYVYRGKECFEASKMNHLITEMDNCNYIHYGGRIDPKEIAREFCKSDIWFYPTHFTETYCISAIEAQLAGCVCVCSNIAALGETVGNRGFLLKQPARSRAFKIEALDTMRKVLQMDREPLRKPAIKWAKEQTWANRADMWRKMIADAPNLLTLSPEKISDEDIQVEEGQPLVIENNVEKKNN